MGKNNERDWGYGSYDVDNDKNENLTYTSYENSVGIFFTNTIELVIERSFFQCFLF